jgi:hypothetical protein
MNGTSWKIGGVTVNQIKLQYLKRSKEINRSNGMPEIDCRMWNVLTPVPGYNGVPTLSITNLVRLGLIPASALNQYTEAA